MEISRALKIDDIYEKVKNYELVLTVEAPLADALNNRLEKPKLGEFAITPKRLAYSTKQNEDIADERKLFIRIVRESNLSWKQAFYLLENILSCWKNTGKLRKILEYDQFNNKITRKIITIIERTPNIYSTMKDFEPEKERKTVVIAPYQFNKLDKEVLPEDYEVINVFEREKREIPEFKIFGTVTGIIQSIRENVNKRNAKDVGIVVEPDSEYTPLLRSLFRSEEIPFMLGRAFSDNEDLRTIFFILKSGLSEKRLKLRDVQPLLRSLDTDISIEHNKEFLEDLKIDELERIKSLLSNVEGSTFSEILDRYEELMERKAEEVREKLKELDILNEKITEESTNRLEYYLDSFDIQVGSSEVGVLLASPKSSSFVDRPILFYLGMDSKWEHSRPEKPWINQEEFEKKNLRNLQLLLQNGEQQHFLVRDSKMGNEITPCLYFDEILDEEFDTFSDLPHKKYSGAVEEKEKAFEKENYRIEIKPVDMISQSDLNKLVKCPREYFFSKLVQMENSHYLEMGSLFHDFAEFYVNHSEFVKTRGLEEFVELMAKELEPFIDDFMMDILKTRIRIGIDNIVEFLNNEDIKKSELEDYEKKSWDNFFSNHFSKSVEDDITEAWFEDPQLGVKGKVDLIKNENHLIDYKSGKRSSSRSIVRSSNVELFKDEPNFQAILYLTHHRKTKPGEKIKFSFFHFLNNLEDVISGEPDLDENIETITYHPRTFAEQLPERETFDYLIEGVSERNHRRKTLEKKGYSNYRSFFQGIELPHEYNKDKLLDSQLAQEYISYSQRIIGKHKYVKKGCESALKKMCSFRERNYFKEDLDNFEEFLEKQLKKLNEYKREGFPVGDVDLDTLDNRDLILGGVYETE